MAASDADVSVRTRRRRHRQHIVKWASAALPWPCLLPILSGPQVSVCYLGPGRPGPRRPPNRASPRRRRDVACPWRRHAPAPPRPESATTPAAGAAAGDATDAVVGGVDVTPACSEAVGYTVFQPRSGWPGLARARVKLGAGAGCRRRRHLEEPLDNLSVAARSGARRRLGSSADMVWLSPSPRRAAPHVRLVNRATTSGAIGGVARRGGLGACCGWAAE